MKEKSVRTIHIVRQQLRRWWGGRWLSCDAKRSRTVEEPEQMICGLRCERVGKCDEEPLFDTARQDRFLPLLPTGAFRDRPSMNRYQQRPRTLCNFPPPPISVALGACPAGMKETRECHAFTRYRRPCHGLYHVAGLPHQAHWPAAAGGCANEASYHSHDVLLPLGRPCACRQQPFG